MMSEKQRETAIAIAFSTQDDLILFLRERWVLGVHVLHYRADFLRIHDS